MYKVDAIGLNSATGPFERMTIERNVAGPDDVRFDLKFCGICHSDVHLARNAMVPKDSPWATKYPIVPGHELAGVVTEVGSNVEGFKVGDKVGVGCIVDTCMSCDSCTNDDEQLCAGHMTMTYNSTITHGHIKTNTGYTFGGYSASYTVNQRYAIKIPSDFPLEYAGPIFCAGITMYEPLKHWGVLKGGKRVGIIGIGGLGQMGIRLAAAMGNEVTAISTSPSKEPAARSIGAKHFVVSSDPESLKAAENSLDLILNTVSANHQASMYLPLLRNNGTQVMLGATMEPHQVPAMLLLMKRISLAGSAIGGIKDTQEVMDFCYAKGIKPEIEIITSERLIEVYDKLDGKNDSIKRYVLDITKSLA